MDLTPNQKMFEAMQKMTDAICGEEPSPKMIGPGAEKVRANRRMLMDFLHHLVALSIKDGAARAGNRNKTVLEQEVERATQQLGRVNGHHG